MLFQELHKVLKTAEYYESVEAHRKNTTYQLTPELLENILWHA